MTHPIGRRALLMAWLLALAAALSGDDRLRAGLDLAALGLTAAVARTLLPTSLRGHAMTIPDADPTRDLACPRCGEDLLPALGGLLVKSRPVAVPFTICSHCGEMLSVSGDAQSLRLRLLTPQDRARAERHPRLCRLLPPGNRADFLVAFHRPGAAFALLMREEDW